METTETTPLSQVFNLPTAVQDAIEPGGELGRDEFLQLLTTELTHQDPLNPVSNQEFASQLAQFSSLEQMEQMNDALQTQLVLTESSLNSMATSMIGRKVMVVGSHFTVKGAADELSNEGAVEVPKIYAGAGADGRATARILDADGNVVREVSVELDSTQPVEIPWDGKNTAGDTVEPGVFSVEVSFDDPSVSEFPALVFIEDMVSTLRFDNGSAQLLLGDVPYTLSDVVEIRA